MIKRRKPNKTTTVKRGRRTGAERNSGRWGLSIREVTMRKGGCEWTTWVVKGFRDESGKRARKKFRTREEADAFAANKQTACRARRPIRLQLNSFFVSSPGDPGSIPSQR